MSVINFTALSSNTSDAARVIVRVCFFFQAKDGIRDHCVTGVQTCALPISLELIVAAPAPFIIVLLPLTIATSSVGLYALATTLLWGRLFFGIPLHLAHPFLFLLAVPATDRKSVV